MLLVKLRMPPTVPAPPFGAISDTIEDPTGAAADSPEIAIDNHSSAQPGFTVKAAPMTASPISMPTMITDWRTRVLS